MFPAEMCIRDRKYIYGADQLAELEPAYAVTVHKSQGSEFPAVIMVDGTWQGLARIYGAEELRRKPLIAMETVGFSWGFMTPDNKNPNFRRNSPEEYRRYAESDTSWGSPRGIGFSGTLPLADAVDPEFGEAIPMMRYGKRILELYRLDSRFCGFAPWFGRPEFRSAALSFFLCFHISTDIPGNQHVFITECG